MLATEPVILCGDFNLSPGSVPYGLAASKLNDVQAGRAGHRPLSTFSSMHPFMRIDHIFVRCGSQGVPTLGIDACELAIDKPLDAVWAIVQDVAAWPEWQAGPSSSIPRAS